MFSCQLELSLFVVFFWGVVLVVMGLHVVDFAEATRLSGDGRAESVVIGVVSVKDVDVDSVALVSKVVKPGGSVIFERIVGDVAELVDRLKLGGLVDGVVEEGGSVKAKRPSYATGAKVSLSWATAVIEAAEDDEIVDENELLEGDDEFDPKSRAVKANGKKAAGRKPCANCTCGLKEEIENELLAKKPEEAQSACGNVSGI